MEFILFLCIEIDRQSCLLGVQFTDYIPEQSIEPQEHLSISRDFNLLISKPARQRVIKYPSVWF